METVIPLPRLLLPLLVVTLAACSQAVPAPVESARAAMAAPVPGKTVALAAPKLTVHRDAYCGCCHLWIEHLRTAGFDVEDRVEDAMSPVKDRLGILPQHASCHTAEVDGYVIEGHVPAADIRRLLAQKLAAIGLAVPGMPVGSPGMDGPAYGDQRDPYDVLLVLADGGTRVFQSYRLIPRTLCKKDRSP